MNPRKGISPVIATVIIVAVALAIAIAAVGWVMGIWGSVTGGTEVLKIMPDSNITIQTENNATLFLHVKNEGGATAKIIKIEVVGVGTNSSTLPSDFDSIKPGNDAKGLIDIPDTVTPGATYTIKIYTAAGNVYSSQLVAG